MSRLSSATVLFVLASARTAGAATFNVDRADDPATVMACADGTPNDCSLRGAILAANALGEPSTIAVPAGNYLLTRATSCSHKTTQFGTPSVTTTALCVQKQISIVGAGAGATIVDGNQTGPVFLTGGAGPIEIRGVTIRNGRFDVGSLWGHGGAINNGGDLTVTDCEVTDNQSLPNGGALYNSNTLTVRRSTVARNSTGNLGGAIMNYANSARAVVTVIDSTIASNQALQGGGIGNFAGDVLVVGSTIRDNVASRTGGGIYSTSSNRTASTTVVNSTISGNVNNFNFGGGLYVAGVTTLRNVTVSGNVAGLGGTGGVGGGIANLEGSTLAIANTVVAGNTATSYGRDCYDGGRSSTITSLGYNLVGFVDAECTISGDATGNRTGVDARLAPLADGEGPSATHALLPDSPAVDAGNPDGCVGADGQPLASDQRGFPRSTDGDGDGTPRCDIGAYESLRGFFVSGNVQPREAGNGGPVIAILHGGGFAPGAVAKLRRSGESDILGSGTTVDLGGTVLLTRFDLSGRRPGPWDVVVVNPDGSYARRAGAFSVATARAPEPWVNLVGPTQIRAGRPARYTLFYGNRGNTDAFAVPLIFSAADSVKMTPLFDIAPPPRQFGKIVFSDADLRQLPTQVLTGEAPTVEQLTLVVPVLPAGFTGALQVLLTADPSAVGLPFAVNLEIADPLFESGPRPEKVAKLVEGARSKSEWFFEYTLPASVDADLTDYMNAQLDLLVAEGLASLAASVGTAPEVFSLSQLSYDLAAFGYVTSLSRPLPVALTARPRVEFLPFLSRLGGALGAMCTEEALASDCWCGIAPRGKVCCPGCSCKFDEKLPDEFSCTSGNKNAKCFVVGVNAECDSFEGAGDGQCGCSFFSRNKLCAKRPPKNPRECQELGFTVVDGVDKNGNPTATCTNDRKCLIPFAFPSGCIRFPVDPKVSHDPNDKSGTPGAGADHFVSDGVSLQYLVRFENKAEAGAPAAEVVITDQLDPARVDLSSVTLGPISFGQTQVLPPPGSSRFRRDVDLRPGRNLVVRIEAGLDDITGLLTWRMTTLDPVTLEVPEDPLAGFLPPNVTPPEGDGSVSFTVAPLGGLSTGAVIDNQARIVFDTNAPIDTPVWSNTIDVTPPTSRVVSVAPASACSRDLDLTLEGSDVGSGLSLFDVLVSEDGGPFTDAFATTSRTARFSGKWGRGYSFRSVSRDLAGNIESSTQATEVASVDDCGPHDLAVTKIVVPKKVRLSAERPATKAVVSVQIQNRGATPEVITDEVMLASIVSLTVDPLAGSCPSSRVAIHSGRPQKALPLTLGPGKKINVAFDVLFECAHDPAKGPGHEDFAVTARVSQEPLGGLDAHDLDDTCPRVVSPPVRDPVTGRAVDRGCGAKRPEGGLGGLVLVDVIVSP